MPVVVAEIVVWTAAAWLAAGLLFAVPFLAVGAGRIDPLARTGSFGFKLVVLPGVVALWPLLLLRWTRGARAAPGATPHDRAALPHAPASSLPTEDAR
ncbi:MAG: hypothetical protein H6825_09500 [Planctomycetes bacterium]|nr:hypothetical protein [Planctomycetota bacterium]